MKIGIDIQSLQTKGSKDRGIGRYTKELISHILKLDKNNDYLFFLNEYYPKPNEFSEENVSYFKIKLQKKKINLLKNQIINEILQFLQIYSSNQDIVHITSPFEAANIFEAATNQYPVVSRYYPKLNSVLVVTLYDLIPLIFPDKYLIGKAKKDFYNLRLNLIKNCDMIFAISETTKKDAIKFLKIDPSKIVNIGSAASDQFFEIADEKGTKTIKKYGITKPFILYTGNFDFRKNLERTIEAFSKIDEKLNNFQLVFVYDLDVIQRQKLQNICDKFGVSERVVSTGKIPDSHLNILYNACELFIFPSLYEGSGLPILEAMKCGTPVIASNTSSMAEIMKKKEYMFNPYDTDDIANLITKTLSDENFKNQLKEYCLKRGKELSWEKIASKVLEQYSKLISLKNKKTKPFNTVFEQTGSINEEQLTEFITDEISANKIIELDDDVLEKIAQSILNLTNKSNN